MTVRWHFRKFRPGDTTNDPIERALFSQESVTSHAASALVRESIQNSLDARPDNSGTATVRYTIGRGSRAADPSRVGELFDGLLPHLGAPSSGLPSASVPSTARAVPFLVVEDSGTTGLTGDVAAWDPAVADDNSFFLFFRALGRSGKEGEQRGRWGVGKFVFPLASQANCWFGYSLASDTAAHSVLGRAVIKTHQLSDQSWHSDGYWGRKQDDDLVLPIDGSDSHFSRFLDTFALAKRREPGLTIVVPWIRSDIDGHSLRAAVVREYFAPILRGELVVEIDSGAGPLIRIDAGHLDEAVDAVGDPETSALISLARGAVRFDHSILVALRSADADGSPRWSDDLIGDVERSQIAQRLEAGEIAGIRVPFSIRPRSAAPLRTYFDIFLKESERTGPTVPVLVREGITIPDAKLKRVHGYSALVFVDDGPFATLVGDAENPSHTQLLHDLISEDYLKAKMFLTLLREAPAGILRALAAGDVEEDPFLLSSFFPSALGGTGATPRRTRRPGRKSTLPDPPPRTPPRYHVTRITNGFSITGAADAQSAPAQLTVACAYEVRRGNPLKRYRTWDFSFLEGAIQIEAEGAEILERGTNRLRVAPERADFAVSVTGFDPLRNLFVRVS